MTNSHNKQATCLIEYTGVSTMNPINNDSNIHGEDDKMKNTKSSIPILSKDHPTSSSSYLFWKHYIRRRQPCLMDLHVLDQYHTNHPTKDADAYSLVESSSSTKKNSSVNWNINRFLLEKVAGDEVCTYIGFIRKN